MTSNLFSNSDHELKNLELAITTILQELGESISRPGLKDTPRRVAKSLKDLTSGQLVRPSDVVGDGIFPCTSNGMVTQRHMEFYSLCEHHLLPFYGQVHVAYLPDQKIIGLSKIGRLVDVFAKRLQVQEYLTHQIAHALNDLIAPKGVAVVIEAHHFCMMMRGVKKQGAQTVTSEFLGAFSTDQTLRQDFLSSCKK